MKTNSKVLLVWLLSAAMLTACGGGGNHSGRSGAGSDSVIATQAVSTPTTTGVISTNRAKTEMLLGKWTLTYTIVSTWTDVYTLNSVSASTVTAGDWNVKGTDIYGFPVVGGYVSSSGKWELLNSGTIIDMYYSFTTNGTSVLSGCYYQISLPSRTWSKCYPLSGSKTALPVAVLAANAPIGSPNSAGKIFAEQALAGEMSSAIHPTTEMLNQYHFLKQATANN